HRHRTEEMAKPLIDDALWELIEPLLPPPPVPRNPDRPGRRRIPDRAALSGALFVLRSGIPWEMLPREMGCGSGMTCWPVTRLAGSRRAGPRAPAAAGTLAPGRCGRLLARHRGFLIDSGCRGRSKTGPNPTDRARSGSKHHLAVDAQGVPLAV